MCCYLISLLFFILVSRFCICLFSHWDLTSMPTGKDWPSPVFNQPLILFHLHTLHLPMMFGCLPKSLVEQEDLFTATSHQHLVSVSSQPQWLINHQHPATGSRACIISRSMSYLFVSPDVLSNYMLSIFFPIAFIKSKPFMLRNSFFWLGLVRVHHTKQ